MKFEHVNGKAPMYKHDIDYAKEHHEEQQYLENYRNTAACSYAISEAISANYNDYRLNCKAVWESLKEEFCMERIQYVLAITVRHRDWDARIGRDVLEWAKGIEPIKYPDTWGGDRNVYFIVDDVHIGLIDMFIKFLMKNVW